MSARNIFLGVRIARDANPIIRTYASDGDANGVFYFAGQNFSMLGTWTNPHTAGRVTISASSGYSSGSNAGLVNRAADDQYTDNSPGQWYKADLGVGRSLIATGFSYRTRTASPASNLPTAFTLQGSNDDSGWTDVEVVTGISGLASGDWRSYTFAGQVVAYRYWRLLSTATDSDGQNYLVIGELEIYGTFAY